MPGPALARRYQVAETGQACSAVPCTHCNGFMITACHCLSILPDFSTSQLWDEGLVSHKHPVGNFGVQQLTTWDSGFVSMTAKCQSTCTSQSELVCSKRGNPLCSGGFLTLGLLLGFWLVASGPTKGFFNTYLSSARNPHV